MQVLHVINSLDAGGAEINLLRLIQGLEECGIANRVWPLRKGGTLTQSFLDAGIQVGGPNGAGKADLLHGWLYAGCVAASIIPGNYPVVWSIRHHLDMANPDVRESLTTRLSLWFMTHLLRADVAICNSHAAERQHQQMGVRARHWQMIPNGVTVGAVDAQSRRNLRGKLGLIEGDFLLLQVARLHPHKGQHLLLDAVQPLLDKHPHLHLIFVGRGCAALTSSPQVHIVDGTENIMQYYYAADWLVNPSVSESSPTVVLEAMSCGTPVIVTNVGGTRELLGEAGVLVGATVADIRGGIEKALCMDPVDHARYVDAGFERSAQFSVERTVTSYREAYLKILSGTEKSID